MSDTLQPQPAPADVTMTGDKLTVTDSKGRRLTIKRLDALADLDLIEAAGGANAENRRWMTMATLAACVFDIDGVPRPFPTTKAMVRNQVGAVGSEGIQAVVAALAPEQAEVSRLRARFPAAFRGTVAGGVNAMTLPAADYAAARAEVARGGR